MHSTSEQSVAASQLSLLRNGGRCASEVHAGPKLTIKATDSPIMFLTSSWKLSSDSPEADLP